MKIIKPFLGFGVLCIGLFFTETHLTSCQKETVYDTLIVKDTLLLKDTLIVKDTLVIRDTLACHCGMNTLKEGLVGYYNFNGGNLNDSSGHNNAITFNNAVTTTDRFGVANNAYLFNGTDSYMKVNNSASLSPDSITLVARVKFNGFYSGYCVCTQIFMKGLDDQHDGNYGLRAQKEYGRDCSEPIDITKQVSIGYFGDGYRNVQVSAQDYTGYVKLNDWRTYVYTYDRKEARFYVDGELKNAHKLTTSFTPNLSDLFIGRCESTQYPYWFNGAIDEIRIYNRPLCATEVALLQNVRN